MVENESAAFNMAFAFLYRIQQSLMFINRYRTNFDPTAWYKEMRVVEAETTTQINTDEEYDKKWDKEYKEVHEKAKESMKAFNELINDDMPDEVQVNEINEAKQKCFEPLDLMDKHLRRLIWKKGWMMPDARLEGL